MIEHMAEVASTSGNKLHILEVGAGTGGTASHVLPMVDGHCNKYVFTDVSNSFLMGARKRFGQYAFVEYQLCNIDVDPRLQGFSLHQFDLIIATNVLHATPSMKRTMENCSRLLKPGGVIGILEGLRTSAFFQMTFGLTDGWWLFNECEDPLRTGYGSPLMPGNIWQQLLTESGFTSSHVVSGTGFLEDGSLIVAQTKFH